MKLTAKLALAQIKISRNRSVMTLLGIALSSAMLTAVCGFVASAKEVIDKAVGYNYRSGAHNSALISLGMILGAVIVTASVIVVSNAFRISAGERASQFGILKSVGATKRQIASSVLYEGVFLSIIGIPAGIIIGLFVEFVGMSVVTGFLNNMVSDGALNINSEAFLQVSFVTPPIMFVVAIAISFGTVLLSAWLPARKAAKIPAIDAIRSAGEVKISRRKVKTSKLTQQIFGFEGTLASKSLKRSSRSFRATVLSLTISIILLIAAGSLGALMNSTTNLIYPNIDADAVTNWNSNSLGDYGEQDYFTMDKATADEISARLAGFENTEIFGVGGVTGYAVTLPDGTVQAGVLLNVDPEHYQRLCKTAGVPAGSSLLINLRRDSASGRKREYSPYDFGSLKGREISFARPGYETVNVPLDGELTSGEVPNEIMFRLESEFALIVPDSVSSDYSWYAKTGDVAAFKEFCEKTLEELAPKSADGIGVSAEVVDIARMMRQMKNLINTIMFFVYGFAGMLALIAVISVVSTISTNIRSRAREFAVLESVGMTKGGIKKMLNLESILCSVRSLIFGLPLGVLASYGLYQSMGIVIGLPFRFPWAPVLECIFGVFIITFITMRFSVKRLKSGSLIETIRGVQ
ncbi:MAG: ABC transporter permease [Oscillospiraceae bacterium]|jgi:putative ABC transport system permease protein|nr:ABC transporter permease [Oscillospiraceae bacterium]